MLGPSNFSGWRNDMEQSVLEILRVGVSFFNQEKYEDAVNVFRSGCQNYPDNSDLLGWFARALDSVDKPDEARDIAERAIALDPKCVNAYRALGNILRESNQKEKAILTYEKALQIEPNNPDLYFLKASTYQDISDFPTRSSCLLKAIEVAPDTWERLSDCYWELAWTLSALKKYPEALSNVNLAISKNKNEAKLYKFRAEILTNINSYAEAEKDDSLAITLDPQFADAYYHRAWLYIYQLDKVDQALSDINQAIVLEPQNSYYHWIKGVILEKKTDHKSAIENYTKAIQIDRTNLNALAARSSLYEKLQNYERSLLDSILVYELAPKQEWSGKSDYEDWFKSIHQHFLTLFSQIKEEEKFVEYFPCRCIWGEKDELHSYNGTSTTSVYGFYGTGYILITDQNVRITSLGDLSKRYPLLKKNKGFLRNLLSTDFRTLVTENKYWVIPNQSITGAQVEQDHINLVTPAMKWKIYNHFSHHLQLICVALNMAMLGKYQNQKSEDGSTRAPIEENKDDIFDSIKKLGELKAAGIISEADFEKKKDELLSRL